MTMSGSELTKYQLFLSGRFLISLLLVLLVAPSTFADELRKSKKQVLLPLECSVIQRQNALNEFLWAPSSINNKIWETRVLLNIMSNYKGPPLSEIKGITELSEFVVKADGTVTWIYHPACFESDSKYPEIRKCLDIAIQESSPLPPCPSVDFAKSGISAYCLISDGDGSPLKFCFSDHGNQLGAEISQKVLKKWEKDRWAIINSTELSKQLSSSMKQRCSETAAYWVCLNPDGKIEKMQAVPVISGMMRCEKEFENELKRTLTKPVKEVEKVLRIALTKSRLTYAGAPVAENEPVGILFLFSPKSPKSINAIPHLFDVPASVALLDK